jgi:hypothetical protein
MLSKLHTETTSSTLLVVLRKLLECEELSSFRLVGGTSLSLQLGHRISAWELIKLDLEEIVSEYQNA